MSLFSTRLKELRKEKKLNQTALAEAIGVSQSMIARWESNECEPTAGNILVLASFFEVSTDYLLGKTEF